jgi:hypothetical protein
MNEQLRKCPTCLTPVAEANLGLRDYRWVVESLPGRVAPMDIDFALEKNGRFLFIEFKPTGGGVSVGARILYKTLVRAGHDVWLVQGEGPVQAGPMDRNGNVTFAAEMSVPELAKRVRMWFDGAGEER